MFAADNCLKKTYKPYIFLNVGLMYDYLEWGTVLLSGISQMPRIILLRLVVGGRWFESLQGRNFAQTKIINKIRSTFNLIYD